MSYQDCDICGGPPGDCLCGCEHDDHLKCGFTTLGTIMWHCERCGAILRLGKWYSMDFKKNAESSGRWDADGSPTEAYYKEREKAFNWAKSLDIKELHWAVTVMASDSNAFTLYERKAILEVVALKLGGEARNES